MADRRSQTIGYWEKQSAPQIEELQKKYGHLQPWQVEARDPEAYKLLFEQEEVAPQGFADQNMITDFLGNLTWRAAEGVSLGALTGVDLYNQGLISEEFGVQDWEDNSWAGRIGGIVGEGIGFVAPVGAIGKGIKAGSNAIGFGSKPLARGAGKKIRSETAETLSKIVGDGDDAILNEFSEELYQAGTKALKTGREEAAAAFGRKTSKVDPFADFDMRANINKNFDDLMQESLKTNPKFGKEAAQNLLDPANKAARDEIRDISLRTAQEYTSENVPRILALRAQQLGLGEGTAQIAGDMAFEAALLGIHGGLMNLVQKGTRYGFERFGEGINDEHYGRSSFLGDVMHGVRVGALLGGVRHIPGGARVAWNPGKAPQAGVSANVIQGGKAIIRKFAGKKATDYTPKQLQTMMRNIYYGSNKNTEFFRGIEGFTPKLVEDAGMLANKRNVKVLQNMYDKVAKDVSKNLLPMLTREVGRDLFESFPRYTTGSIVMNAEHWYKEWDHMTADRIVTDYLVGAFYMKRGKTRDGKPAAPRFLTSKDINGNEIGKLSKAFDVMGWDKGKLDLAGSAWDKVYEDHMFSRNVIQKSTEASPQLRNAVSVLEKDMVPVTDQVAQLQQPGLKTWSEWTAVEYTKQLALASEARKAGNEAEARRIELAATDLLRKSEIARSLVDNLTFGIADKTIMAMDKTQSLEFVDRLNNIELGGKKLTIDNVEMEIQKLRKGSTFQTTSQTQLLMEDYIKNSLEAFGLWDKSMETDGVIRVHPTTIDLLLNKLSSNPKMDKYSEAIMTLKDVLINADKAGVIRLDERAIEWNGQTEAQKLQLDRFLDEYRINTERMHDALAGTRNSGWRDLVPGKKQSGEYLDRFILSSFPIWDAINTNMLHLRNDVGLQVLTGKGAQGTESVMYLNEQLNNRYFDGKRRIELVEGEEALSQIGDKPHLINLLRNLNRAWQVTEGANKNGTKQITVRELEALNQDLSRQVGNLFTDSNSFNAFKNYLDNHFIDGMLGDATSYGAKRAVADLLAEGNPLAFTDPVSNRRVIASGESIRKEILGSEYGQQMLATDPAFADNVRRMVNRYIREVEGPTKGKGGQIEYSNNLTIGEGSIYSAKDWMQSLIKIETLLDGSKFNDVSRVYENIIKLETLNSSFNTASHMEQLAAIATERLSVEQLKTSLDNLRLNTRNLSSILTDAIQNNDFLMLRSIVDRQYDIDRAINRAKQFTREGKGSIDEVTSVIEKVALDAVNERNRKLALDSIESVDEFIRRQEEVVTRTDRSGKPVIERQTISESQYKSKYGTEQSLLDLIKGDLVAFAGETTEAARLASSFLNKYPQLKDMPVERSDVFNNLEGIGISAETYMQSIVKPIIEAEFTRSKAVNKDISYDQFLTDTAQLLVSSWAQKKVAVGNYENGNLRVSQKSITNWDAGFLGLINSLGIANKPGSFMLFGEASIAGNRIQTKLSESMLQEINSKLALGAWPKVSRSDLFSAKENAQLKELLDKMPRSGEGQDGKPQFQVFRLDEKQAIVLSTSTYADIVNRWRNEGSPLRQRLIEVVGEEKARRYLEENLKINDFKNDQLDKQSYSTETIESLLLTTRLLKDNAYYLDKLVSGDMSRQEVFKALKYLKLSNPRGGITLNQTTLDIMRYFTKEVMPNTPQTKELKRHFDSQMERPHKQVTIYDEKGPGENFFNSDTHTRQILKKQFMEEGGMTESQATAKANEIADKVKPEAKSIVDGEIYLSLPEMTALLTARGADASWFVWEGNKVVGFNTVIKPVVSQSKVKPDGTIDVVIDKTAYKYDPNMDAAMRNADGSYFTDSIAFKSASKVNQTKRGGEWSENVIGLTTPKDVTKPWKPQIALELQTQRRQAGSDLKIVEIDRANMMLKSISGPHDGTLSMAFGNFLSNPAQEKLNSWLGSGKVVSDLNQNIADLYNNPFAFKAIAEKLKAFDKEAGDITSQMTGLEAVLAEGGIPIFEHMRPQIERALVGNYLGSRNFASGQIGNGGYNVMTAGDGLSLPVRENGMQKRFGGSGIPHVEANKNIRNLLQDPSGVESISLAFRLSEKQAKDLNTLFNTNDKTKNINDLELFKHGDEILVSGDGNISGTFDGYINRTYADVLTGAGRRDAMIARATALEVANSVLGKSYKDIIERAKNSLEGGEYQVQTLSELVRFIDGNPLSAVERQNKSTYNNDYIVRNGEGSIAKELGYQAIRVMDTNLRTPKDGLNSWVLTGIEKIIDARKGAVSEMNAKDLINPQDADFDLDKSASFFGTPGSIVKEIHAASGYHEISSQQIWDKASYELAYEQPQLQSYINELKALESARPTIVRQHSLTSLLYQYFGSLDGIAKKNILKPGYTQGVTRDVTTGETFRASESTPGVNIVADMSIGKERYQIEFRHGAEFVDAIGHMKKVIKHTIDTYGDLSKLNQRDMMDTFWFSEEVGLFKLTRVDGTGYKSEVQWNSSALPKIETVKRKLKTDILRPINQIFNLGLGYETLSNGSTRKLGFYDHIKTFERAKNSISQLSNPRNEKAYTPELSKFANDFLGFLGEFPNRIGTSNHPLISGLMQMEKVHNKNFPLRIERGSELANLLAGTPVDKTSKAVQDAVNKYMNNERNWARFQSLQWEVNQLENILNDMRSRRQHETTNYSDMQARKEMLTKALGEVEVVLNDKIVQNYNAAKRKGYIPEADAPYAVYKKDGSVFRSNRGEPVNWNAGDVVVKNPRVFRFSDPIQQKHLRTMHRAFGIKVPGVEKFDVSDTRGYTRSTVEDVQRRFREIDSQFADASVKNNAMYSDLYTMKLEVLKDVFNDAMTARGPQYAKQLLYTLLTPRVSNNEMSIMNYDNKNDSYYSGFRFRSNKLNESVVFRFMTAAMDGKVSGFNKGIAREWFKEMMQAQKVSYLMTHDKSLSGDAFKIGNMDRGIDPQFNVLPTREAKPRLLDVRVNNEQARKTIQSYLTGSYFLDPIELYRLTTGLDKTVNELPSGVNMGERVKRYWEDVGQRSRTIEINEGMGDAVYRLSKSPIENSMNGTREHIRRKSFSEKLWEEINCN